MKSIDKKIRKEKVNSFVRSQEDGDVILTHLNLAS